MHHIGVTFIVKHWFNQPAFAWNSPKTVKQKQVVETQNINSTVHTFAKLTNYFCDNGPLSNEEALCEAWCT